MVAGRLNGAGKIGIRVGKVVGRYKMAKHYTLTITDDTFSYQRNTQAITAEAALDGLYVIATTVGPEQMDAAKVVATYKSLARVERDFRSIKSIDLDLRGKCHDFRRQRMAKRGTHSSAQGEGHRLSEDMPGQVMDVPWRTSRRAH